MPQFVSMAARFVSTDLDQTAAFYAQFGFVEVGRYVDEGYLLIRREGVELHFSHVSTDHDPDTNQNAVYARVIAIAGLASDWGYLDVPTDGCPRYVAPKLRPWGMIEGHIVDPDGNLLLLGAVVETEPES